MRSADRNLMKFSKGKCKVLPLGRNNPMQHSMLGADWLQNNLAEKDLGSRQSASWTWAVTMCHCSRAGQWHPGMHEKEQVKRGDPSSLTWCWWDAAGVLVLGSMVQETQTYWSKCSEGPQGCLQGDIQEEAERSGTVYQEKMRLRGILAMCINTWLQGSKENGHSPGQPASANPALKRGFELNNLERSLPISTIVWSSDIMK